MTEARDLALPSQADGGTRTPDPIITSDRHSPGSVTTGHDSRPGPASGDPDETGQDSTNAPETPQPPLDREDVRDEYGDVIGSRATWTKSWPDVPIDEM
jgi:hypothetical protein